MHLPKFASDWIKSFREKHNIQDNVSDPITRMEARSLIVQFIADLKRYKDFHECVGFEKDEEGKSIYNIPIYSNDLVSHSLYLGKSEYDGDNSDNGHWVIDTNTGEFVE